MDKIFNPFSLFNVYFFLLIDWLIGHLFYRMSQMSKPTGRLLMRTLWRLIFLLNLQCSFYINVWLICPQISSLHPAEERAERPILRTLPKSLTWLSGGNISIFSRAAVICLEEHRRRGAGRRKISYGTTNKSPLKRTRCVCTDLLKILSLEVELLRTPFFSQPPQTNTCSPCAFACFSFHSTQYLQ